MKKFISYVASLLITISVAAASPSSALIQSFNAAFPNAGNVKWHDEKNGYSVSFNQNGNFEKVVYDKKGDFVCSWKYSDGKDLPTALMLKLQKKYNDNKIIGVTEFADTDNVLYEVKLTKGDALYSVKAASDGRITSSERLN